MTTGTDGRRRRIPMDTWRDLEPREPRSAEVVLAPPPRFRPPPAGLFQHGGPVEAGHLPVQEHQVDVRPELTERHPRVAERLH